MNTSIRPRLQRVHTRIERFLDVVFGYYRIKNRHDRRGPGGLVFIAPLGPRTSPSNPRGFRTWLWAWGETQGYEVTVLGHSLYAATLDGTVRSFLVLAFLPITVLGLIVAAALAVI